ncbi:TetR/AcrR family transcriptional regulator [Streptomyces cavernicola]|uniref:TetR family transcriptional regulator n=1 Tax=Streptomyces cavernicola TaxID=3043613 RepID=A0ABT6SBB2_9ACTN|nr:TetR family transcriptional regulator [Streptomyces sp. B-S-A6]MDI3405064.1 TetR family transcriptional regulator [Streptomyces sp. B-S-A6]
MPGSSLTERRKAATRRDIAHTAAALFVEHGLRATRAEDIAREAGVSPRTFFRYFATKEESVAPLFAAGTQRWVAAVRAAPDGLSVADVLIKAADDALDPAAGSHAESVANAESLEWVRALLRMAEDAPALRSVWNDACFAAETALLDVLAERSGVSRAEGEPPSRGLRLAAAVASTAIRVSVECWAATDEPADGRQGPGALAARSFESLREFPWSSS